MWVLILHFFFPFKTKIMVCKLHTFFPQAQYFYRQYGISLHWLSIAQTHSNFFKVKPV